MPWRSAGTASGDDRRIVFRAWSTPILAAAFGFELPVGMTPDLAGQRRRRIMRRFVPVAMSAWVAAALALCLVQGAASASVPYVNWDRYLRSYGHSSMNAAATSVTPANAASLEAAWSWAPDASDSTAPRTVVKPGSIEASPTVHNGVIYLGTMAGYLYAIDEATGASVWKDDLGWSKPCPGSDPTQAVGISDTVTAASDPVSGHTALYVASGPGPGNRYVYPGGASTGMFSPPVDASDVAGATGGIYLNAINPDGTLIWRASVSHDRGSYAWSSPVVIGGHVYVGMASYCDKPLMRGGIREYDQHTGVLLHTYWATPAGTVGASVWSTPATDGRYIWASVGNGRHGDSFAIVRLTMDLRRVEKWTVPGVAATDLDFGSSPTLFRATKNGRTVSLVGACNKNGVFYAFRSTNVAAGPYWTRRISLGGNQGSCLAAAVWDSGRNRLLASGPATTIAGAHAAGSVRALNPATGAVIWTRRLSSAVIGTPTLDGAGVLAVATWGATPNTFELLRESNGAVLRQYTDQPTTKEFGQPVFADTFVFRALATKLVAYHP
jgi:outer membrane protein assembly factor BamB